MFVFGFFFIASGFNRHYQKDWKQNKEEVPPAEEGGLFHNLWSRLFGDQGDEAALKEKTDLVGMWPRAPNVDVSGDAVLPVSTNFLDEGFCEAFHDIVHEMFRKVNTADDFRAVRTFVRTHGGLKCIGMYLSAKGLVIGDVWQHKGHDKFIYNIHAQIGAELITTCYADNSKHMTKQYRKQLYDNDQKALGKYSDKFVLARNLYFKDKAWNDKNPDKNALPSMGKRHRFLDIKDQHWKWFNVVAFGLDSEDLPIAIRILKEAKKAAKKYVQDPQQRADGWKKEKVKLYFHAFGHNSVPSLHMHIIDTNETGKSYDLQQHKNLLIDDVIQVLEAELAEYQKRTE